jgi:hypothetical protein
MSKPRTGVPGLDQSYFLYSIEFMNFTHNIVLGLCPSSEPLRRASTCSFVAEYQTETGVGGRYALFCIDRN